MAIILDMLDPLSGTDEASARDPALGSQRLALKEVSVPDTPPGFRERDTP
jgi:hypothetical protein